MTSGLETITEVWGAIGPYMDFESLVSLSKTCNSLHDLAVDSKSGKIKAPIVHIEYKVDDEGKLDPQSPSARIPGFVPKMLNALHFPSISQLRVSFPERPWEENNGQRYNIDNEYLSLLPILSQKIRDATNVEELQLDMNPLINRNFEMGGALYATYNLLGGNLARAIKQSKKLKRLYLFNDGGCYHNITMHGQTVAEYVFSNAFLAAMVPVIQAASPCLEEVTLQFGDVPLSSEYADAVPELFAALFRLPELKVFRIQMGDGPILSNFIGVCNNLDHITSRQMKEVSVFVRKITDSERLPSIAPFLTILRELHNLQWFQMCLPDGCWKDGAFNELMNVLNGNPSLYLTCVDLDTYTEEDCNQLLDYTWNIIQETESRPRSICLALRNIGYVDEESSESYPALLSHVSPHNGEPCLKEDDNGYHVELRRRS